jgi:hypothetical protein
MKETKFIKLAKTKAGFAKKMTYLEAFKTYGGKMVKNPVLDEHLMSEGSTDLKDKTKAEKIWTLNMIGAAKKSEKLAAGEDLIDYEAKTLLPGKFIHSEHAGSEIALFIEPENIEKTETNKGEFFVIEPKKIVPVEGVVRLNWQKISIATTSILEALKYLMKNGSGILDNPTGLPIDYKEGMQNDPLLPKPDEDDDGEAVKIVGNVHYILPSNWVRHSYIPENQLLKPIYRKDFFYMEGSGGDGTYYTHGLPNQRIYVGKNIDKETAQVAIWEILN